MNNAIAIRKEWMSILQIPSEEIELSIQNSPPLSVEREILLLQDALEIKPLAQSSTHFAKLS